MQNFLIFIFGFIVGVGLVALFSANKPDEKEYEKAEKYKQGYEKGFKDGCELQKSHLK
jgi:hypothetical protein